MSIVREAKGLLRAAKILEKYTDRLKEAADSLQKHHKHYKLSRTDIEKQYHLKKHLITFASARKIKQHYKESFKDISLRLNHIERELKRLNK
ncbi:MAG: hypothetical protein U9R08_01160 [Nanoarchaeota archaeon]|nr:hypothetical protein [Nanoarchaeota archaeon]